MTQGGLSLHFDFLVIASPLFKIEFEVEGLWHCIVKEIGANLLQPGRKTILLDKSDNQSIASQGASGSTGVDPSIASLGASDLTGTGPSIASLGASGNPAASTFAAILLMFACWR